jgi:hypothetical protein
VYGYSNADWSCTPAPGHEELANAWAEIPDDVPSSHRAQLASLLDAFEERRRPPASAHEIRPTIELISSLYKSAATGQRIARGSIVPGDPFYQHAGGTLAQ